MTQSSRPQAEHISNFPFPSDPGPYSGDQWAQLFQILYTGDQQATQGPLVRYLNELAVTDNGGGVPTEVYVATGAGVVNGHVLISSEQETFTIPAGPAAGRTDRVVMVENNQNFEVTQTTAARPLLFPDDLSEYTGTPGVPPYSARLAIVRGVDGGGVPGIDQTAALYMVELYRYSINNVPTISAQVDYRDFCFFSSTVGIRRLFVPASPTDFVNQSYAVRGVNLRDTVNDTIVGFFTVPRDFKANMSVTGIFTSPGTGNIVIDYSFIYGQCSENYGMHSHAVAGNVLGLPVASTNYCLLPVDLTQAAVDDIVRLWYQRQGGHGSDSLADSVWVCGWIVEYEALS